MDSIEKIPLYLLILSNIAVMYMPRFVIKKEKTITGKALKELYPESAWIRWGFLPLYICWIIIIFSIPFLYNTITGKIHWLFSIYNSFAAIGMFLGLFTILTRVMVMPYRSLILRFVTGSDAFKAARLQLAFSSSMILINSIIQYVIMRQ